MGPRSVTCLRCDRAPEEPGPLADRRDCRLGAGHGSRVLDLDLEDASDSARPSGRRLDRAFETLLKRLYVFALGARVARLSFTALAASRTTCSRTARQSTERPWPAIGTR